MDKCIDSYLTGICAMFSAFIYIVLIMFPWIIEIILVTQQKHPEIIITLTVCGAIQTLISMLGGFKMGMDSRASCVNCICKDGCNNIWCGCFTKPRTLFTSGYVIYFLPQWVVTNMIVSWALIGANVALPLYTQIMIYTPILVYTPSLFVGYAFQKSGEDGAYTQVN